MIGEALFSHLTADAGVALLAGTRVYPLVIPQHVYNEATKLPCVVYQRTGTDLPINTCGAEALAGTSMRIDAYARSYDLAVQLAAAVRAALVNHAGPMGSVHVSRVNLESELDLLDIEPGLYRVSQTYSIWHEI
jgi:hypothetical protein